MRLPGELCTVLRAEKLDIMLVLVKYHIIEAIYMLFYIYIKYNSKSAVMQYSSTAYDASPAHAESVQLVALCCRVI
jgi:hypothetical protein